MTWTAYHEHQPVLPDFEIRGRRILLRPPRPEDEGEWLMVRARNRQILEPYEPKWPYDALTSAYYQRRILRIRRDWNDDRAYSFLIFKHGTEELPEELIGGLNINNVCRGAAQFASVGYWLDLGHQGQGLMRAALRMIIYFSHDKLKLHRLNASVLPENTRSINLLEHVGFEGEGFAPAYIEINGMWQDHLLYGLILSDFIKRENRRKQERK